MGFVRVAYRSVGERLFAAAQAVYHSCKGFSLPLFIAADKGPREGRGLLSLSQFHRGMVVVLFLLVFKELQIEEQEFLFVAPPPR